MTANTFDDIIATTVRACREVYGDRLRGVVVFGSAAVGSQRHDSDIDLLVVAEPLPRGRVRRMEEFRGVEELVSDSLRKARELGVATRLSPIVRTFAELDLSGFLIFDIASDGVVRYDSTDRVSDYLAAVRERLERRGAERRELDGRKYWVLDPNVKPGDVVTL